MAPDKRIKIKRPSIMTTKLPQLPDEVLCLIFLAVVQEEPRSPWKNTRAQAPWNVSAVCRVWRRVALDSARLWTRFQVGFGIGYPPRCKNKSEFCLSQRHTIRCMYQLQRSGSMPISVDMWDMQCQCMESMVRLLAGHVERWEVLRLRPTDSMSYDNLRDFTPSKIHFASLRHLEYECDAEQDICLGHHFDVSVLPSLTSFQIVRWDGTENKSVGSSLPKPREARFAWTRLTRVYLQDYRGHAGSILSFLKGSPVLASFRISAVRDCTRQMHPPVNVQDHPHDSIILAHLVHLDIEVNDEANTTGCFCPLSILPVIRTPGLSELVLTGLGMRYLYEPQPNADLSELVLRSQCLIRTLQLSISWGYPDDPEDANPYPSFLQQLTAVQSLRLTLPDEPYTPDDCAPVLRHMLRTEDTAAELFPNLQRLHLAQHRFDPCLLLQVIQSRNDRLWPKKGGNTQRLDTVEVDFRNAPLGSYGVKRVEDVVRHYAAVLETGLEICGMPEGFRLTFDPDKFVPFQRLTGEFGDQLASEEGEDE
ncbi:hypothetical protein BDV98DRAFT_561364 [Pterulicium gracile]|uniref:Uncharacterized protein n=1 Tax=Pterulicium gracile TaxID=1884261 RepID=A0A5C3QUH7_9AGAR|nr:hypothetical protein BDV98DRAFT_561364 [Pterula gracilis]